MKSVLIVEDIDAVAASLTQSIRRVFPGVEVRRAGTIAEAIQHVNDKLPDFILLDLGLPDGCGNTLLLHRQVSNDVYVVITTIFDDDEYLFEALRLGAKGYLLKDDIGNDFDNALAGILSGRPPLSAGITRRILATFKPTQSGAMLSARETELLTLIAQGYSVQFAAEKLGITYNTAAGYLKTVYQKLNIKSRAEAARKAIQFGLI